MEKHGFGSLIPLNNASPFPINPNFGETEKKHDAEENGRGNGIDEAVGKGAVDPSYRRRSAVRTEFRNQIRQDRRVGHDCLFLRDGGDVEFLEIWGAKSGAIDDDVQGRIRFCLRHRIIIAWEFTDESVRAMTSIDATFGRRKWGSGRKEKNEYEDELS